MLPDCEDIRKWLSTVSFDNYQLKEDEVFDSTRNLVLCRHCGKPKRILSWSDMYGNLIYRPSEERCDCEKRRIEEEERREQIAFCKRYYNTDLYVEEIDIRCRRMRLKDAPEGLFHPDFYKTRDAIAGWVDQYQPGSKGFGIIGGVGLGKSTLMAGLRNEMLDRGYSCVMATMTNIINHQRRRTYIQNEFSYESYSKVDVLIIDDVGADFIGSGFDKSVYTASLFSLINYREVNGLTVCYTSNMYRKDLLELGIDRRAVDRLEDTSGSIFTIRGESVRSQTGRLSGGL